MGRAKATDAFLHSGKPGATVSTTFVAFPMAMPAVSGHRMSLDRFIDIGVSVDTDVALQ
jgi:hypothetical protein